MRPVSRLKYSSIGRPVDDDLAGAALDEDPGDRTLAAAGAVVVAANHGDLRSRRLGLLG